MPLLDEYRKINRFVVTFADVDMMRHVNNVAYLRWAEQARSEYLAEIIGESIFGKRGMILARTTIDYLAPLSYRERVALGCRVGRLGSKSFDFFHDVVSEDRDIVAAKIVTTLVAYDYEADTTIAIPDRWRDIIAAFEKPLLPGVSH